MSKLAEQLAVQIKATGLPQPEREYVFAPRLNGKPLRRWRFDFCWPVYLVALEVEGGIFMGGRHVRGQYFRRDAEKHNAAVLLGWRVLRVTDQEIRNGSAVHMLEIALGQRNVGELF